MTLTVRRGKDSILTPGTLNAPVDFYDLLSEEAANIALQNTEFMQGTLKYAEAI